MKRNDVLSVCELNVEREGEAARRQGHDEGGL
jgi:hypothetical protein